MFFICTTIPYINGTPHLGHLLEAVFHDTIFRYQKRLMKGDVRFSMGLDQHGLKIFQKAESEGKKVQDYVAEKSQVFKDLWQKMEILNTDFVETSSPKHRQISQMIWKILLEKGLIYKKSYTGLYCVGDEAFVSKGQLRENGMCPNHDEFPIEMQEENYFFKLSDFQAQIKDYLQTADIRPEKVRNEWLNFVKEGLEDISISRDKKNLTWGVPVPDDENQVMYVWFEALLNYLTAVMDFSGKYDEELVNSKDGKNDDVSIAATEQVLHQLTHRLPINFMFIGKDMPKFHLVIWIGMLTALGLPLTKTSMVHGFINDKNGRKMSKSLGNGVSPDELLEKFGLDGTRYVMMYEINHQDDTDFNWEKVIENYNANLANNIGNLVIRITNLIEKYFGGLIDVESVDLDSDLLAKIDLKPVYQALEDFNPSSSLAEIFKQYRLINQFLEEKQPWILAKDMDKNRAKVENILTQAAVATKELAKALSIFLPIAGSEIIDIFSQDKITKAKVLFKKTLS